MKMTITIEDELYWKFQKEIAERRVQQKDAVAQAIAAYVKGPALAVKPPIQRKKAEGE